MKSKICTRCKESKSLNLFYKWKRSSDGYAGLCKACHKIYSYKWKEENPKKILESHLKFHYELSLEQYNQLLIKQNNACKICKTPTTELKKAIAVDHDHTTGKIRGLLCQHCNQGLGHFKDSVDSLKAAIEYLTD